MSSRLLCIGGAADGRYVYPDRELKHNDRYGVPARASAAISCSEIIPVEIYKVWQWRQGEDDRTRLYLIPRSWDGFKAMDWVERKAYRETRHE